MTKRKKKMKMMQCLQYERRHETKWLVNKIQNGRKIGKNNKEQNDGKHLVRKKFITQQK